MAATVKPVATTTESNNYFRVMANSPAILHAYKPLHDAIMGPGELDERLKTLAYLASSYVNESPYQVSKYHALALNSGFSEDDIRAIRTEQDHIFKPMEHATLRLARDLSRTVTIDDLDSNELDVFTAEQLVELVAVVALANFDNRFSNALEVEQDPSH